MSYRKPAWLILGVGMAVAVVAIVRLIRRAGPYEGLDELMAGTEPVGGQEGTATAPEAPAKV